MKNKKTIIKIIMGAIVAMLLSGCANQTERQNANATFMGTVASATIYGQNLSENVASDFLNLGLSLEKNRLSRRIEDSTLSKLNEGLPKITVSDAELMDEIEVSLNIAAKTDGAFDPTLGNLTSLWKLDELSGDELTKKDIPTEAQIEEALLNSGYEQAFAEDSHISFDLGGVGKGIYLDEARRELDEYNTQTKERGKMSITAGVITAGGSVLTYGNKPDGNLWQVGIINPQKPSELIGSISLHGNNYISTSGDYQRYAVIEGEKYHHILDSKTGYPAKSDITSVTVVIPEENSLEENVSEEIKHLGLLSDAYSTACYVRGEEEAMKLATEEGFLVLFIREDGTITGSEELLDALQ